MAKVARCGYGSQGQGLGKTVDGYTYIVNDNVRSGDKIQVVATARNGKNLPRPQFREKCKYTRKTP